MVRREVEDELRNPKRRDTLKEVYLLESSGGTATTYRLGQALGIATSSAKSRAEPLVEKGLIRERWEEVSERGADTRVYETTEDGREALLEAVERRLLEIEEEKEELRRIRRDLSQ
ncbi:MAG: hypothetical protein MAG715_00528 [Methanonatronarchaeales archaeon]|nr:hypothetical protein [Methanonatronarchaeales archaeon]